MRYLVTLTQLEAFLFGGDTTFPQKANFMANERMIYDMNGHGELLREIRIAI